MIPDFAGQVIEIVKIDYGLYLWTAEEWEILLAGPVTVSGTGTPSTEIDVDLPDLSVPAALAGLVGATISQVLVAEDGHVGVQLADRRLSVRAAQDYEAWQIAGPDGELLICMPGGKLAYFPPRSDSTRP